MRFNVCFELETSFVVPVEAESEDEAVVKAEELYDKDPVPHEIGSYSYLNFVEKTAETADL